VARSSRNDRLSHDVDVDGADRAPRTIRGVLQVLNKQGASRNEFDARDEEFVRALAEQIGRALDYTTLRGDDASRGMTSAAGSTT